MKLNKETAKRIFLSSTHKSLKEAVLADVVDIIPIAGDVGNAFRMIEAAKKGESTKLVLQTGDFVIGLIPVIGAIGDLITPTNTLIFVLRKQKFMKKIKTL